MHKNFDFSRLGGFPVSQNRLAYMQQAYDELQQALALLISPVTGNSIIAGCETSAGVVSDGWVCIGGEILPFVGGADTLTKVSVISQKSNITFHDGNVKDVQEFRYAVLDNAGSITFSTLIRLKTISSLTSEFSNKINMHLTRAYNDNHGYDLVVRNNVGTGVSIEGIIEVHFEDISNGNSFALDLSAVGRLFSINSKKAYFRIIYSGVTWTGTVTLSTDNADDRLLIQADEMPDATPELWGDAKIVFSLNFE